MRIQGPVPDRRIRERLPVAATPADWVVSLPAGLSARYLAESRGGVLGTRMDIWGNVTTLGAIFIDFSNVITSPFILAVNTDVIDAHFDAQVVRDSAALTTLYACTVERNSSGDWLAGTYADFYSTRLELAQRDCDRTCNQATTHHVTLEFLSNDIAAGVGVDCSIWFGDFYCVNLG